MRTASYFSLIALVVFALTMTVLAICFCQAGFGYMDVGLGLHPAVAFPLATLCMAVLIPATIWVANP